MTSVRRLGTFLGGQNDVSAPEYLNDSSYARGFNGKNRGGHWSTRPRVVKLCDLPVGRFQGMSAYRDRHYVVIAGFVYPVDDGVLGTAVPGVEFSQFSRMTYTCETNDNLVISDGVGNVAIVGDFINRMAGEDELNNTGIMAFGHGRIFFTDKSRRTLMAADIYFPGEIGSELKITEQQFLNEGLFIRQPMAFGKMTGMEFMRNSESGTGLGQLIVVYEFGVCAYNVYLPRASDTATQTKGWLDSQIGAVLFRHEGAAGPRSIVQQNNDLIYYGASGINTIRSTTSEANSGIRTLPISMPISNTLKRNVNWATYQVSGASHDNYVLYTSGLRVDRDSGDYYYDSLIPIDFVSFYSQGEAQVTFDGQWVGQKYLQVLSGEYKGRLEFYVVTKEDDNANVLNMLDENARSEKPTTLLVTKRMFFDDAFLFSKLSHAELWLENIQSDLEVKLYFRGDSGIWYLGGEGTIDAPYYTSAIQTASIYPQVRNRLNIPMLSVAQCDPATQAESNRAAMFQFAIEITGLFELARVEFVAKEAGLDVGEARLGAETTTIPLTKPAYAVTLNPYQHLEITL